MSSSGTAEGGMPKRSFTLLDVILLVAGAGIGSWFARMLIVSELVVNPAPGRYAWATWIGASNLLMLGISLGIAGVRIRQPRPPIRRLGRQPGFLAEVAVVSIVVLGTGLSVLDRMVFSGQIGDETLVSHLLFGYLISIGGPWNVGFAVILAWVIGGLQGFRCGRADWVEWAGRFLGVLWLVLWLAILSVKLLIGLEFL